MRWAQHHGPAYTVSRVFLGGSTLFVCDRLIYHDTSQSAWGGRTSKSIGAMTMAFLVLVKCAGFSVTGKLQTPETSHSVVESPERFFTTHSFILWEKLQFMPGSTAASATVSFLFSCFVYLILWKGLQILPGSSSASANVSGAPLRLLSLIDAGIIPCLPCIFILFVSAPG